MIRARRAVLAALLAVGAIVLSACSGLPTSGPVYPGLVAGDAPEIPDFSFQPDRPQPGASPEQIVEGFVAAATSPAGEWATASLFLAPEFRTEWAPEAGVIVDVPGSRRFSVVTDGVIQMETTTTADVDASGAYYSAEQGEAALSYELAEQEDGEWRITAAPDGIVLDADAFETVYRPYSVMYFDPTWSFLAPDVRWYPARTNIATRIAQAIIEGSPSPWLASSVVSAVPEGVGIARVTSEQGVAQVDLTGNAVEADPVTLGRLLRQLQASLMGTGVAGVELAVDGAPLAVEPAQAQSTAIDSRPLALTASGFGFVTDDELEPIPGLSDAIEGLGATAIAVGRGEDVAAVAVATGGVVRVDAAAEITTVDTRAGLADPVIDPTGTIWTVPRDQPSALRAAPAEGDPVEITGAFPGVTRVEALQVSRDGTRMAAIVTQGGRDAVVVAGIVRDAEGRPVSLGETRRVTRLEASGIDIAWLDEQTVGVVVGAGQTSAIVSHTVGGVGTVLATPSDPIAVAAGATSTSARLLTASGELYVRRGSAWQIVTGDVAVLASQMGSG